MDTMANCSYDDVLICQCSGSEVTGVLLSLWFVSYVLLVPVFLSVLYLGYGKWKKRPRSAVSHSDVFTFHMVAVELLTVPGAAFFSYGLSARVAVVLTIGACLCSFTFNGQLFFHCLTCVERYLAVVHPIAYLRLKKRGGVVVRNVVVGAVWLVSFSHLLLILYSVQIENLVHLALVILSLVLMSFCSVSVLCVLIRPGPGEKGVTKKQQLNHLKKSALHTIMTILAVMVIRLVNNMLFQFSFIFHTFDSCLMMGLTLWANVPSSLVLPVLFLQKTRTRK